MRRLLGAAALAAALAWLASLGAVIVSARRDRASGAAAIIVLGAAQYDGRPSPVLRARLQHAALLFERGLAPLIVVTGGRGEGDTTSEAAVGRRWLLARGLPDTAIIAEQAGRASEASLRAVRVLLPPGARRVILVSDGFHMRRLEVVASRLGLEPLGSPAPGSPIRANPRREAGYFIAESVKWPAALFLTRTQWRF